MKKEEIKNIEEFRIDEPITLFTPSEEKKQELKKQKVKETHVPDTPAHLLPREKENKKP